MIYSDNREDKVCRPCRGKVELHRSQGEEVSSAVSRVVSRGGAIQADSVPGPCRQGSPTVVAVQGRQAGTSYGTFPLVFTAPSASPVVRRLFHVAVARFATHSFISTLPCSTSLRFWCFSWCSIHFKRAIVLCWSMQSRRIENSPSQSSKVELVLQYPQLR